MNEEPWPTVDIGTLDAPGRVLAFDVPGFPDGFIACVQSQQPLPGSVPAGRTNEYLVAFSRRCTHMGAHVLGLRHTHLESIEQEGVVRCPAHLTCFDLRRDGLVVIGQACSRLPQIVLSFENAAPGHVCLVEWNRSGYGEVPE